MELVSPKKCWTGVLAVFFAAVGLASTGAPAFSQEDDASPSAEDLKSLKALEAEARHNVRHLQGLPEERPSDLPERPSPSLPYFEVLPAFEGSVRVQYAIPGTGKTGTPVVIPARNPHRLEYGDRIEAVRDEETEKLKFIAKLIYHDSNGTKTELNLPPGREIQVLGPGSIRVKDGSTWIKLDRDSEGRFSAETHSTGGLPETAGGAEGRSFDSLLEEARSLDVGLTEWRERLKCLEAGQALDPNGSTDCNGSPVQDRGKAIAELREQIRSAELQLQGFSIRLQHEAGSKGQANAPGCESLNPHNKAFNMTDFHADWTRYWDCLTGKKPLDSDLHVQDQSHDPEAAAPPCSLSEQDASNLQNQIKGWQCTLDGWRSHKGYWMDCHDAWTFAPDIIGFEKKIKDAQQRLSGCPKPADPDRRKNERVAVPAGVKTKPDPRYLAAVKGLRGAGLDDGKLLAENWKPENLVDLSEAIRRASKAIEELYRKNPSPVGETLHDGTTANIYESLRAWFGSGNYERGCFSHQSETYRAVEACSPKPRSLEIKRIQVGSGLEHHAIVVFPPGTDWQKSGVVLDAWSNQSYVPKEMTFTYADWRSRFGIQRLIKNPQLEE